MVWVSMLIFLAFQVRLTGVICRLGEVGQGVGEWCDRWWVARCCVAWKRRGPLRDVTCRVVGQVARMGGVD